MKLIQRLKQCDCQGILVSFGMLYGMLAGMLFDLLADSGMGLAFGLSIGLGVGIALEEKRKVSAEPKKPE